MLTAVGSVKRVAHFGYIIGAQPSSMVARHLTLGVLNFPMVIHNKIWKKPQERRILEFKPRQVLVREGTGKQGKA